MTYHNPDHLPMPLVHFGNDPDALEDDTCSVCEGSGNDPDIAEARGIFIMCPRCGGTGVEP